MKNFTETFNNIQPMDNYLDTSEETIQILFTGTINHPLCDNDFLKYIKPDFENADLVVGQYREFSHVNELPKYLKNNGVHYVTCASQNCYDSGLDVVKDTVEKLYDADLWHTGVYRDNFDREKHNPSIIKVKGIRIGFINYTEKLNDLRFEDSNVNIFIAPDQTLRQKQITSDIELLKAQNVDIIICCLDWANENRYDTTKRQKTIVDWLFTQNVDAVICSGRGYVQKCEFQHNEDSKPTLVAYSLGNFVGPHYEDENANGGIILKVNISKEKKQITGAKYKLVWCSQSLYEGDNTRYVIPIKSQNIIKKDMEQFMTFITDTHNLGVANNVNVDEEI